MSSDVYAAISNAFYKARNEGRTMTNATDDATEAVESIIAAREDELAERIAVAIEALRPDAAMPSPLSYKDGRDDASRIARSFKDGGA